MLAYDAVTGAVVALAHLVLGDIQPQKVLAAAEAQAPAFLDVAAGARIFRAGPALQAPVSIAPVAFISGLIVGLRAAR